MGVRRATINIRGLDPNVSRNLLSLSCSRTIWQVDNSANIEADDRRLQPQIHHKTIIRGDGLDEVCDIIWTSDVKHEVFPREIRSFCSVCSELSDSSVTFLMRKRSEDQRNSVSCGDELPEPPSKEQDGVARISRRRRRRVGHLYSRHSWGAASTTRPKWNGRSAPCWSLQRTQLRDSWYFL